MDHNYARNCYESNDIPCVGESRSVDHDHVYSGIPDVENNDIPGSGNSEGEGVTIPDPGGERRTVEKTELSLDMKTFLVANKSLPYKEVVKMWNKRFKRAAPTRRTVDRVRKRAREENIARAEGKIEGTEKRKRHQVRN